MKGKCEGREHAGDMKGNPGKCHDMQGTGSGNDRKSREMKWRRRGAQRDMKGKGMRNAGMKGNAGGMKGERREMTDSDEEINGHEGEWDE